MKKKHPFISLKYYKTAFILCLASLTLSANAQQKTPDWGDQGNGTYINPILNADYSDPDVIRVGEKYYMIASDFHFIGMQVLESDDMVNWKLISQIYDHFDHPEWNQNKRYGAGAWAPSLRYHDGKFWMFVSTPHELYMSQAENASGPWSPLHVVKAVGQWEDPCPLWDDDGNAYLGRSQWGGGPIIIHRMSPDGRELLDDGRIVYTGPVAEGVKLHKWNGYYYISIPEGGVSTGWQTILRSRNIYGPYEKKVVLEQGSTDINGPHQAAKGKSVYLRVSFDAINNTHQFYYSTDNKSFTPCGQAFSLRTGSWKGIRTGLYTYNTARDGGKAYFDWFIYRIN